MENSVKFEKGIKLTYSEKLSEEFIKDIDVKTGHVDDDFIRSTVTRMWSAMLWDRMNEEQTITVVRPAPSFWDWLWRRPAEFHINIKCRELLRKPPVMPKGASVLVFHLEEIKENEE